MHIGFFSLHTSTLCTPHTNSIHTPFCPKFPNLQKPNSSLHTPTPPTLNSPSPSQSPPASPPSPSPCLFPFLSVSLPLPLSLSLTIHPCPPASQSLSPYSAPFVPLAPSGALVSGVRGWGLGEWVQKEVWKGEMYFQVNLHRGIYDYKKKLQCMKRKISVHFAVLLIKLFW